MNCNDIEWINIILVCVQFTKIHVNLQHHVNTYPIINFEIRRKTELSKMRKNAITQKT